MPRRDARCFCFRGQRRTVPQLQRSGSVRDDLHAQAFRKPTRLLWQAACRFARLSTVRFAPASRGLRTKMDGLGTTG
jgi:hypothetical protein